MRTEEIKEMWIEQLMVPNDLSKEELIRFWSAMDRPYSTRVETVKIYSEKYNLKQLIETGTYLGMMIDSCLDSFEQITSIEVDFDLYNSAKEKFSNYPHIDIVYGDSGKVLPEILKSVTQPCIFWLDGHYVSCNSTFGKGELDTPILKELQHILSHPIKEHVILIDDARCFIGLNEVSTDYPTIQELKKYVAQQRPDLQFELYPDVTDIIRIYPG